MKEPICRVCLSEENVSVSINGTVGSRFIYEAITEIANVIVNASDEFPQSICMKCLQRLEDCIKFKAEIESSDQILKSRFQIKLEDDKFEMKMFIEDLESINHSGTMQQAFESTNDMKIEPILEVIESELPLNLSESSQKKPRKRKKARKMVEQNQKLRCCMCGKVFKKVDQAESHALKAHLPEVEFNKNNDPKFKSFKYSCMFCKKMFRKKCSIPLHLKDKDFVEQPAKKQRIPTPCQVCGKMYSDRYEANVHYLREHSGEQKFGCDICSKTFPTKKTLNQHILHHGPRNHICEICSKAFLTLKELKVHQYTHSTIKPFECDYCGRTFGHKFLLKTHVMQHAHPFSKPFKCDQCSKSYKWREDLKSHSDSIHRGIYPYPCSFCQKGYQARSSRKYHEERCNANPKATYIVK